MGPDTAYMLPIRSCVAPLESAAAASLLVLSATVLPALSECPVVNGLSWVMNGHVSAIVVC